MVRWIWHVNVLVNQLEGKVNTWARLKCSAFSATKLLPPLYAIKQCVGNIGNDQLTLLGLK
eukprot:148406-Ditylum_brightwellii.AAC.1